MRCSTKNGLVSQPICKTLVSVIAWTCRFAFGRDRLMRFYARCCRRFALPIGLFSITLSLAASFPLLPPLTQSIFSSPHPSPYTLSNTWTYSRLGLHADVHLKFVFPLESTLLRGEVFLPCLSGTLAVGCFAYRTSPYERALEQSKLKKNTRRKRRLL